MTKMFGMKKDYSLAEKHSCVLLYLTNKALLVLITSNERRNKHVLKTIESCSVRSMYELQKSLSFLSRKGLNGDNWLRVYV